MNDSLPSNELLSQAWDDIDSLMEYAFDNGFHELGYDPARVISDEMERVAQELADLKAAGSSAPEPSAVREYPHTSPTWSDRSRATQSPGAERAWAYELFASRSECELYGTAIEVVIVPTGPTKCAEQS
jgi:hypothetical protein